MLADASTEVRDLHVFGMDCVRVQAGAISKRRDQTSVIGSWQEQCIKAHEESSDFRDDIRKRSQPFDVLLTRRRVNVRAIFPDYDVRKHARLQPQVDSIAKSVIDLNRWRCWSTTCSGSSETKP